MTVAEVQAALAGIAAEMLGVETASRPSSPLSHVTRRAAPPDLPQEAVVGRLWSG